MSNNFYLSLLSGILHLSRSGLMCLDWDISAKNLKPRQWALLRGKYSLKPGAKNVQYFDPWAP